MKYNIENGKWKPENGTFVKVPNEQIPEVIQMLMNEGQIMLNMTIEHGSDCLLSVHGKWAPHSTISRRCNVEIPFPDFKALVTGKLPESFCIQCTEESMKHEAWERFIRLHDPSDEPPLYMWMSFENGEYWSEFEPVGEVLQIETWVALKEVAEVQEDDELSEEIYTDEVLIKELKSRGYTVSKIY